MGRLQGIGRRLFRTILGLTREEFAQSTIWAGLPAGLPALTAGKIDSMERFGSATTVDQAKAAAKTRYRRSVPVFRPPYPTSPILGLYGSLIQCKYHGISLLRSAGSYRTVHKTTSFRSYQACFLPFSRKDKGLHVDFSMRLFRPAFASRRGARSKRNPQPTRTSG